MVSITEVHPGNLLISKEKKLYCIIKVMINRFNPELSIIRGVDENNQFYEGQPEDWFYLWQTSCLPDHF